jgi:pyruvate/2-oxoglutarate dehydrogenase complex dihydrolipoamide acyltransferase (E2) component
MQWQPLAAAATVACLAFMLVQTLPRDREMAPPVRMEAPASAPAPAPAPDAALETRSSAPPSAVAESPASPGAGQAARDRGDENAARSPAAESDHRKGVMTEAPGEAYSAEAAAPTAADWAARIEALHATGDRAGAAEALREFRAVDPHADSHLPESLRDWARSVE